MMRLAAVKDLQVARRPHERRENLIWPSIPALDNFTSTRQVLDPNIEGPGLT